MSRKLGLLSILFFLVSGCTKSDRKVVKIDGSSTVFPVTEAVAEEFHKKYKARVTIGVSGTGGGFKKFCHGKIDISGASRHIKPSEIKLCKKNNIKYVEVPVAYDGISVVVHPSNTWVDYLTVAELKKMWEPAAQKKILFWNQIRSTFPKKPLHLFGPGVDSGTYDYFTKVIVGKSHASRGDITSSEDDNVLVHGVSTDINALGFFGFAYYTENKAKLRAVPILAKGLTDKSLAVLPTYDNIKTNTYKPLSRPIFNYVSLEAAKKKHVQEFMNFYLSSGSELVADVGYVPITKADSKRMLAYFR